MTQNIQNGSFDIKTGSRILRIINAAKRASPPSISSYKRGAHGSALTSMLKMLLMYFILNFSTLYWFSTYAKIIILSKSQLVIIC